MRGLLKFLWQLSDLAYLAMIPCALLILVAVIIDRRDLGVLGAAGVILLSIARLVVEATGSPALPVGK